MDNFGTIINNNEEYYPNQLVGLVAVKYSDNHNNTVRYIP